MELEDLLTEAARLLAQFSAEVKAASAASGTGEQVLEEYVVPQSLRRRHLAACGTPRGDLM